jgi:predicted transcriptional regulator of viral defense system
MTNIYEIKERAIKSGRVVFSVAQLANLMGKPKSTAKVYMHRMVKKGIAKKLMRGKISFSEDDYAIASQLVEPSYISLDSALLFHELIMQVPASTECVTTKNAIRYRGLGISYHRISPRLFYGYKKQRRGDTYAFMAEAEKALIDAVYLNAIAKKHARELAGKMDGRKLKEYIARFQGRGKKKLVEWLL